MVEGTAGLVATVRIKSDIPQGYAIINKADYEAEKDLYELYVEPVAAPETTDESDADDSVITRNKKAVK